MVSYNRTFAREIFQKLRYVNRLQDEYFKQNNIQNTHIDLDINPITVKFY